MVPEAGKHGKRSQINNRMQKVGKVKARKKMEEKRSLKKGKDSK
jgi:hypothetical protein